MCPRSCGADRASGKAGVCGTSDKIYVARTMLHMWEEPCISGKCGAGAIFFSGCNLHCVYCQNAAISGGAYGKAISESELERAILELAESGALCIELITPTHVTNRLVPVLERVKPRLKIPTVWNSGGYEKAETLASLDGLIDIYMPDFKYFSPELSKKLSSAEDYADVAISAAVEMLRQVGRYKFRQDIDENGSSRESVLLASGVIVRHLVLPSHRDDSVKVLELLNDRLGADNILLSLMSQYTPDFYLEWERKNGRSDSCGEMRRRVTSFEYKSVLSVAEHLGFNGYFQSRSSARSEYTPDFK